MPVQVKLQYTNKSTSGEINNISTIDNAIDDNKKSFKLSRISYNRSSITITNNEHISKTDISASSRLNSYICCFVAYLVQVISIIQFKLHHWLPQL